MTGVRKPPSPDRVLFVAAVLLVILAALPWVLDYVEQAWGMDSRGRLREWVGSGVTIVLGIWIFVLVRRQQIATRRHLRDLEHLSVTDPLTGLGNRRALERDLDLLLSRSRRRGDPVTLLYMDVDGLKALNDRHGHAAGDETLRELGAVLRSNSRLGSDTAYRVGGDEFVMLLTTDPTGAETIAQRVALAFLNRSPHDSRVSLGMVTWDGQASVAQLLDEADSRMYRQKRPPLTLQPV